MRRSPRLAMLAIPLVLLVGTEAAALEGIANDSEASGTITTWVWHYDPSMTDMTGAAFEAVLRAVPHDVRFLVSVTAPEDASLFLEDFAPEDVEDRPIEFIVTGHRLTPWARDRYIIFERADEAVLLLPDPGSVDLFRQGDLAVANALSADPEGPRVIESGLALEGGNVLLTRDHVLVGPGVLDENEVPLGGRERVRRHLEALFDREAIVVGVTAGEAPHEHVDMYVSVVRERTLLVADPRLALEYFDTLVDVGIEEGDVRGIGYFTREEQIEKIPVYDRIAAQLRAAGFEVVRLPVLHGEGGEMLTWNNAIVEERGGSIHAYVPSYGIPLLDRKATETWRAQGVVVHPIPCVDSIVHGGAIRCLSNVLLRDPIPSSLPTKVGSGADGW